MELKHADMFNVIIKKTQLIKKENYNLLCCLNLDNSSVT